MSECSYENELRVALFNSERMQALTDGLDLMAIAMKTPIDIGMFTMAEAKEVVAWVAGDTPEGNIPVAIARYLKGLKS